MILASAFLNQLQSQSTAGFAIQPVYLLYGEEPLFLRDCFDGLRSTLKAQGYLTGDVYDVDASFDWQSLQMETQAGSLFSDTRMILVNMPKGAPGREGTKFIQNWCQYSQAMPPEVVVVIQCEKLDSRQTKSKWVQAIESAGLVVQAKPVPINALPSWCQKKATEQGLVLNQEAASLLAERVEGNLLAADQELLKLSLILPPGSEVSVQVIQDNVVDQAHYQLFALSTAILNGRMDYAQQMLMRLRQEGVEAPILLWLLSKELRQLIELSQLMQQGSLNQAFKQAGVWSSKQAEYSSALKRQNGVAWQALLKSALNIDLMIKGIQPTLSADEVWLGLSQLVSKMAQ
ncbi:MAG: DNA polymerase III subunit delta [Gammaproteobacteria bacterium]|nr:DNA polymerase III subunit delta [Gammaproteobacteria bacterium]